MNKDVVLAALLVGRKIVVILTTRVSATHDEKHSVFENKLSNFSLSAEQSLCGDVK